MMIRRRLLTCAETEDEFIYEYEAFHSPEPHQTRQIGRLLWALGHDPYARVLLILPTRSECVGMVKLLKLGLEDSVTRAVFPWLGLCADSNGRGLALLGTAKGQRAIEVTTPGGSIGGVRINRVFTGATWTDGNAEYEAWFARDVLPRLLPSTPVTVL